MTNQKETVSVYSRLKATLRQQIAEALRGDPSVLRENTRSAFSLPVEKGAWCKEEKVQGCRTGYVSQTDKGTSKFEVKSKVKQHCAFRSTYIKR